MWNTVGSWAFDGIVAPILANLALVVATTVVGWLGILYTRVTGERMDAKHQASIQSALENGFRFAVQSILNGQVTAGMNPAVRQQLIEKATDYVKGSVPDAVRHFDLSDWKIGELLLPKFPIAFGDDK